jgi:hypothetical protein
MKNGKFNTYPTRADQDPSKPLPAFRLPEVKNRPAWWTANDDADRNTAARGCMIPESDCMTCMIERCPVALRLCRVCDGWSSDDGVCGRCDGPYLGIPRRDDGCTRWRARA